MAKPTLTKKQAAALGAIIASPGKSGRFYRKLGHAPQTLAALERLYLVDGKNVSFFDQQLVDQVWSPRTPEHRSPDR